MVKVNFFLKHGGVGGWVGIKVSIFWLGASPSNDYGLGCGSLICNNHMPTHYSHMQQFIGFLGTLDQPWAN